MKAGPPNGGGGRGSSSLLSGAAVLAGVAATGVAASGRSSRSGGGGRGGSTAAAAAGEEAVAAKMEEVARVIGEVADGVLRHASDRMPGLEAWTISTLDTIFAPRLVLRYRQQPAAGPCFDTDP